MLIRWQLQEGGHSTKPGGANSRQPLDRSAGAITVHSVVAPSGELRGKGRSGVFAGKTV